MAGKSKVDVGKGFKRIFYVIATVWGLFCILYLQAESSECIPYKDYALPLRCESWWASGWLGPLLAAAISWAVTTIPLYYFLRWIIAGFKK